MRNIFIATIILLMPVSLNAQQFDYDASIHINPEFIKEDSLVVELSDQLLFPKYKKKDTRIIINNLLAFKCKSPFPYLLAKVFNKDHMIGRFIMGQGENNVEMNDNYGKDKLIRDSIYFKVDGSAPDSLFKDIVKLDYVYFKKYSEIVYDLTDSTPIRIFNNIEKTKEFQYEELDRIIKNPYNYFSLMQLCAFEYSVIFQQSPKILLQTFNYLSQKIKLTTLGRNFEEYINQEVEDKKSVMVGTEAPSFSVMNDKGRLFKSSDLRGSVAIINFSAVWCGPCQLELKPLEKLYQKFKNKGLEIVYFNLDDNKERWLSHIKKNKLDWTNVSELVKWDKSVIAKQYFVNAIPQGFLLDRNGKIIYTIEGIPDNKDESKLERYIEDLLKK